ncbi:hypothetical protein AGDE_13996 [Angomonas deanei]|uniref:Uncharacterized protein n=1 Tax=Angomonas deanei TaxID=59799 RepID=A0A7G2CFI2_9TRYP|nr:hypothetical protein AGDE_13996 [Angomonas deanei]CAD2217644.1 hypothetical protein, conserved [Angomonas deanei]|eukprot:EPY21571.1 hypothetical protein AGDE_13996 [Angomonas deanei]
MTVASLELSPASPGALLELSPGEELSSVPGVLSEELSAASSTSEIKTFSPSLVACSWVREEKGQWNEAPS